MKPTRSTTKNRTPLLAIALCLAGTVPLAQAEEGSSNGARDFLSDPQRVGSLTGTILGGALTAHPVGTVAGSIIGFFIGKQTMHKSTEQQQLVQPSYARRTFAPTTPEATTAPMLALNTAPTATATTLSAVQQQAPEKTVAPAVSLIASAPATTTLAPATQQQPSPAAQTKTVAPVVAMITPVPIMDDDLQSAQTHAAAIAPPLKPLSPLEQIASYCYGNGAPGKASNPDLQALCYYHQSS